MSSAAIQQAIVRAARENGIDPSFALAVAERESSFNPRARNSKTIRGLFQMTGNLREKYGIGDTDDPYEQASGWARFIRDEKATTARTAGRDISDAEAYSGHHFGGARAGRMMRMDPSTTLDQVFTPYEMSINPHFGRAGTVGNLLSTVTSDIGRRQNKFGGGLDLPDFAEFGDLAPSGNQRKPAGTVDLAEFGTLADAGSNASSMPQALPKASGGVDLAQFGTPA